MDANYDVIIIGGGIGGLSAAIILARSLRSVAVVDSGRPRNASAHGVHNYPGREGTPPLELLEIARGEAAGYGATSIRGEVVSAERVGADFRITLGSGETLGARRLVLATGLIDQLPDIPGLGEFWGTAVIHCPYCHGYEVRGRAIGVIATGPMSVHQALLMSQLSPDVTYFANGHALEAEGRARFDALGIPVVTGEVESVTSDSGTLTGVRVGGVEHAIEAIAVAPRFEARTELFESLGGEASEHPSGTHIPTETAGRTAVEGVYAAGNAADPSATVIAAAAAGTLAGGLINADLVMTDADRLVAAARNETTA